jgi:hypothetical protein
VSLEEAESGAHDSRAEGLILNINGDDGGDGGEGGSEGSEGEVRGVVLCLCVLV